MTTPNDNNNRNFSVAVNLTGVPAAGSGQNVETGFYKTLVDDMYVKPEKPNRVIVRVKIAEGPFMGAVRTTGLNIPENAESKSRYYWRAFAESCGYTAAQLDTGAAVNLNAQAFLGRVAHIKYTQKEHTGTGYDNTQFLTPEAWARDAANFVKPEAAPAQPAAPAPGLSAPAPVAAAPAPVAAAPAPAAPAAGAGGVLSALGLPTA